MGNIHKILMLVENSYVPVDPRVWAEATTLRSKGFQVSIICPKGPTLHKEPYICMDDIHIYRYTLPTYKGGSTAYLKEYGVALWMTFLLSIKVLIRHGFDAIHERGHCLANRVFVVRNGPDLKLLKPVQPEPDLKRGKRYLLAYLGLIGSQDGVRYALYALHELIYKRGRRDILLVVMGDGDDAPVIHRLADELELNEYINFTGWIERKDVQRYLTITDIGICPEPKNGMNEHSTMIKTMEYMAMGKPIVAFDLAETRFSAQDAALYATTNRARYISETALLLAHEFSLFLPLTPITPCSVNSLRMYSAASISMMMYGLAAV